MAKRRTKRNNSTEGQHYMAIKLVLILFAAVVLLAALSIYPTGEFRRPAKSAEGGLCGSVVCQQESRTCPDGVRVFCTPACYVQNGQALCGSCTPSCVGHENQTGIIYATIANNFEANVYVDNVFKGWTPINISTPEGIHEVKFTKAGYLDNITAVFVTKGETVYLNVFLRPVNQSNGTLILNSTPVGAKIWINGDQILNLTPTVIKLSPGNYSLILNATAYKLFNETFELLNGQFLYLNATMERIDNGTF